MGFTQIRARVSSGRGRVTLHHNAVAVNELNVGSSHTLPVWSVCVHCNTKCINNSPSLLVKDDSNIEYRILTEHILVYYLAYLVCYFLAEKGNATCRSQHDDWWKLWSSKLSIHLLNHSLNLSPEHKINAQKLTSGIWKKYIGSNPFVLVLDWLCVEQSRKFQTNRVELHPCLQEAARAGDCCIFCGKFVALIVRFAGPWNSLCKEEKKQKKKQNWAIPLDPGCGSFWVSSEDLSCRKSRQFVARDRKPHKWERWAEEKRRRDEDVFLSWTMFRRHRRSNRKEVVNRWWDPTGWTDICQA